MKPDNQLLNLKVLLIEDDPISSHVMSVLVESFGCTVDVASTGTHALELLKKSYDLILLDIGLPDMDGFSLVERFRSHATVNLKTPIIVQTANILDLYRKKCAENGIHEIITKPIKSDELKKLMIKVTKK